MGDKSPGRCTRTSPRSCPSLWRAASSVRKRRLSSGRIRRRYRYPNTPCRPRWTGRRCPHHRCRMTQHYARLRIQGLHRPRAGSRLQPKTTPLAPLTAASARLPAGSAVVHNTPISVSRPRRECHGRSACYARCACLSHQEVTGNDGLLDECSRGCAFS